MYRARIELLEKRKMFSVTDLILDPFNSEVAAAAEPGQSATIVDFIDEEETSTSTSLGKMHLEDISLGIVAQHAGNNGDDESISIAERIAAPISHFLSLNFEKYKTSLVAERSMVGILGDFNGDGKDELASVLAAAGGTIGPQAGDATVVNRFLLPYMEQDNVYKMTDITDGTSNTIMFATAAPASRVWGDPHVNETDGTHGIIAILIGLTVAPSNASQNGAASKSPFIRVDTSNLELSTSTTSIDVWEHAYLVQPARATNGIIAVLIGLSVDPSDPSGNTYAVATGAMAGGSVPLIGGDKSATASPLASDEYYSRFASTTLDDEALVATTYCRGAAAQITHDMEFETWASKSKFDRSDESSSFYDLLISGVRANVADDASRAGDSQRQIASDGTWGNDVHSILHEENEFSFPRMITAGEK